MGRKEHKNLSLMNPPTNQQPKAYILTKTDANEIQKSSVYSAKMLCGMIKTCLGPRAMHKMVLTKINSVEMTNDGNSILRELDVGHPSARALIELSKTQDDECGDGTTSVIVLASELLDKMVKLLDKYHPIKVCKELSKIREEVVKYLAEISNDRPDNKEEILSVVRGAVATKLCTIIKLPLPEMALEAAYKILDENAAIKCDIKNNIKIDKVAGDFKESTVIDGIIIEKDIIHPQMTRYFDNPKILMIDCGLEYKKGESATNIQMKNADEFTYLLKQEEEQIRKMVNYILDIKPNMVLCEKGVSDLAYSILYENGITCLRRFKKTDMTRIAKATGATIVNRLEDATVGHLGECGVFEYKKINQSFYCLFKKCKNPRAISILLAGPTKDLVDEIERNFMDGIKVARNMIIDKRCLPGGGATEMAVSVFASQLGESEIAKDVSECVSSAFKIIPSILATNSGESNTLELLNELFSKHKKTKNTNLGIDGITGKIDDMSKIVNEPFVVKSQCFKSAFDCVIQLLRVDGIIECVSKSN